MICNIKTCSHSICSVCNNMNDFDCEYKEYKAIGTTEECRNAIENQERIYNILTMLSIQSEQHKVILASDIFETLEDVYPNWNKQE